MALWRIDLVSLRLFVAVCEESSIARAAEREFIAPSAVSKRINDLESLVGSALLQRHKWGVRATPAGEALLHHARNVLRSLEKMQGDLSEYTSGVRGHIRIFANVSSIVETLLPTDADADAVRAEIATASRMGITGVPCFLIEERYAVMGAQDTATLADAIRQVADAKARGELEKAF